MTATVWAPYVSAVLNGSVVSGIVKARVVSTISDPVTKAYITIYPAISWTQGMSLTISLGAGVHNVLRFTGTVYEGDYLNSGASFALVARGPLYKAQKYRNNVPNGLTLDDLTSGPATDEDIAKAVLTVAGVSYTGSDIGGTGITRGTLAPSTYTWRNGETALAYLQRLTQASLGYRMIETIGGAVKRVQVFGRPQGTSVYTLTEGVDIFDGGHTQRQTFDSYSAVTISGFDYGDGAGAVTFSDPSPTPAGVDPFQFSSTMIERALEADAGDGVSAEAVAANVRAEVNRELIRVNSVQTPRDDLFGPGQTHTVNSPLLGLTNEPLWLSGVTCEVNGQWFTQTLDYAGGGTSTGGYTGP